MGEGYRRLLARLEGARTLGVSFGLDRIREALARLGHPERACVTLQVAGTNGKGSTAAMTEAILRAAGLRTGLFTSPHLARFTERIRIDGAEIDGDRLAALDPAVVATGVPLTYFEISAVLAFRAFAEEGVDVAVLETGLGGRLDAVTAASPVATAITSIGLDHTDLLGDTLEAIAREKAGIAKPGVPLLLGPLPPEADAEIARVAVTAGAPVRRFGVDFFAPETPPALAGAHQRSNAAIAVALAEIAALARGQVLSSSDVARGLTQVTWPGRMEWLAPAELAALIRGPHVEVVDDPAAALALARGWAAEQPHGYVVVAGSIFLIGELRARVLREPVDPILGGDPLP
jgi:dihydrofolate synthase/folylpolyglutamate synthase